jgi:gamma-aminobutyric acid receptor subunit alpha
VPDCIGTSFKAVGTMIHVNFEICNLTVMYYKRVSLIPGEYSMLLVSFHLQRHMGNFLIQVYGPCVLLVVLSWVSFWLNREATADRVSLGKVHPTYSDKIPLLR